MRRQRRRGAGEEGLRGGRSGRWRGGQLTGDQTIGWRQLERGIGHRSGGREGDLGGGFEAGKL